MSQPRDATADSILVYHPDGKITPFAEGLHVVLFSQSSHARKFKKNPGLRTGVFNYAD